MKTEQKKIDMGELLSFYMESRFVRGEQLANLLGRTGQTISKYRTTSVMRSDMIAEISYALKHNFFQDMANLLPAEFTVNTELNSNNQRYMDQLQEENKVLKIQNELLIQLNRKGS
ncbi:hypothetical protein [Flavobacterium sp. SM2513]|uniref:hypothetical protein n=1 Tax=Flavobacterium sp. SM2513 TaxID=3424766 RepID=UPI003D7F9285